MNLRDVTAEDEINGPLYGTRADGLIMARRPGTSREIIEAAACLQLSWPPVWSNE